MELNFKMAWPQSNPQSIYILPSPAAVTCSPVTDSAASTSCTFTQVGVTDYTGAVSNIVTAGHNATSIKFKFGPVWTPPSTMPQGSFTLTAKDGGKAMSQCTAGQTSGMTAGSLSAGSIAATTKTVNSNTQITLTFKVNTNVVSSDTITVTFPT